MLATEAGLGNGETAIFPIHIFKVKEGVNYNPEDPNYDLFKLACRVSAKRLFPNFSFIDAPFNLQFYKEGDHNTEAAYMGCRTKSYGQRLRSGAARWCGGRGNLSFTSINLPRIAIKAHGDIDLFFEDLDRKLRPVCGSADGTLQDSGVQEGRKTIRSLWVRASGWIRTSSKPNDSVGGGLKARNPDGGIYRTRGDSESAHRRASRRESERRRAWAWKSSGT